MVTSHHMAAIIYLQRFSWLEHDFNAHPVSRTLCMVLAGCGALSLSAHQQLEPVNHREETGWKNTEPRAAVP